MSNIEGKHIAYLRVGCSVELDTHMIMAENRTLHHWTFRVRYWIFKTQSFLWDSTWFRQTEREKFRNVGFEKIEVASQRN